MKKDPNFVVAAEAEASATPGLIRDERGIAAVEFALILPLMILLYFGSAELTQGIMADRKMTLVARSLADLVAQQQSGVAMTDATMTSIFGAATAIMNPFGVTSLKMSVSAVEFVTNAAATYGFDAKVRWNKLGPQGGTARSCAKLTPVSNSAAPTPTTLPNGLYSSGSLIIADVSYQYTPRFGGSLLAWSSTDTLLNMRNTTYMRPRNWTTYITYPAAATGNCSTY